MEVKNPVIAVNQLTKAFLNANGNYVQQPVHYALRDLNFTVNSGDVVGVVGENGSGKSTLLKLLSGIYKPTSGSILLRGKIASILDIGSGFHQDLSGHENIYLSGTLLGMTKSEISKTYNEIVQYSGIGDQIHSPVKHYSSGMYLRLAFSVIVHLDADIFLFDEVISVGDAEFRIKSQNKIKELCLSGKTVIIASHEMRAIQEICNRCILLEHGHILKDGDATDIINSLMENSIIKSRVKTVVEEQSVVTPEPKEEETPLPDIPDLKGAEEELTPVQTEVLEEETNLYVSSKKWDFNEAPGNEEVKLLSVKILGDIDSVIYAGEEIAVEVEYEKLTNRTSFVGMLFNYQFIYPAMLANPVLYLKANNLAPFDTSKGTYRTKCIIPRFLLNKGVFSVDLFFVYEDCTSFFHEKQVLFFKVEYKQSYADEICYVGESPVSSLPMFRWSKEIISE